MWTITDIYDTGQVSDISKTESQSGLVQQHKVYTKEVRHFLVEESSKM